MKHLFNRPNTANCLKLNEIQNLQCTIDSKELTVTSAPEPSGTSSTANLKAPVSRHTRWSGGYLGKGDFV